MEQHVRAGLEMLGTRILDLAVADAVLARDENHRGGRNTRNVDRVVSCAAHHFAVRIAERSRCGAHRIHALRIETRCRKVVDLLQVDFNANVLRNRGRRVAKLAVHDGELVVIGMPHIDAHLHVSGNHVARIGRDLHEADRRPSIGRVTQRERMNRFDHPRRGQ